MAAIPPNTYYGPHTALALRNFPISGQPLPTPFLIAHATLKKAAARTNQSLGLLSPDLADAIAQAADEIIAGAPWSCNQFPVDLYQTGSATSTNMNLNEVLAARANQLLGHGSTPPQASSLNPQPLVHPNDHVNLGQSSNDTIPTSLQVMALCEMQNELVPALHTLHASLLTQSRQLWPIIKTGRTHLQDATPIRLGQVFLGYAGQLERSLARLAFAQAQLQEVPLGGTAVGTGLNAHPRFAPAVIALLNQYLHLDLRETSNHFQAQATLDAPLMAHAVLRTIAVSLTKIANDIRWMASGPRAGLGELELPALQPGSSIMPGKVNPVIAESLLMVCQRVLGNDTSLTAAALSANFELALSLPLVAHLLHESITLLAAAAKNFATQCIDGLKPTSRGPALVESGLMLATALVPVLGYDAAAALAKEAAATGKTIRQLAREKTTLSEDQLTTLLDPAKMVDPLS